MVFNVPRILIFSNSADPLPRVSILQPFRLVAKLEDSNLPEECITRPTSFSAYCSPNPAAGIVLICESVTSHPAILLPCWPNIAIVSALPVPDPSNILIPYRSEASSEISPNLIISFDPVSNIFNL